MTKHIGCARLEYKKENSAYNLQLLQGRVRSVWAPCNREFSNFMPIYDSNLIFLRFLIIESIFYEIKYFWKKQIEFLNWIKEHYIVKRFIYIFEVLIFIIVYWWYFIQVMIPLIFVFKSKINACSEFKKFELFQFQKYDETLESRKLSHKKIMHSSSQ